MLARTAAVADEFDRLCPEPGNGTLENNLAQLALALVTFQRALLPLLAGLIGQRALLRRFVAELHSTAIGGPDRILSVIHGYLGAEQQLGRIRPDAPAHVTGVLLFAITQLQALVTQVQAPDSSRSAVADTLTPFITYLVGGLVDNP